MPTYNERVDAAHGYLLEHGAYGRPLDVTAALGFTAADGQISILAMGDPNPDPAGRKIGCGLAYLWANQDQPADTNPDLKGFSEGWLFNIYQFTDGATHLSMGDQVLTGNAGLAGRTGLEFRPADIPEGSADLARESALVLVEQAIDAHRNQQAAA